MKKLILWVCALAVGLGVTPDVLAAPAIISSATNQDNGVVFRKNQRLKSSDGRELYLYTNGKAELYDGDRLVDECEYTINGNEIKLMQYGRVCYKASFEYKSDGVTIRRLRMAGTDYYQK